jgi:hypothetical protein
VQRRSRGCIFQSQAEEFRGIKPVHGGPAVGSVADVARDALVAGDVDESRDESVIASPWFVGASRTIDNWTPREARESTSSPVAYRVCGPPRKPVNAGSRACSSRSVATRPGVSPRTQMR